MYDEYEANVRIPAKVEVKEAICYSKEELRQIINAIECQKYKGVFLVIMLTGIPLSECLGLAHDKVDLDAGTATISQSLIYKDGKAILVEGCRNDNTYKIHLAKEAVKTLLAEKETQDMMRFIRCKKWSNPYNLFF